jgi:hypothetical protein
MADKQTPTLPELIKLYIKHELSNVHVALPGEILKYDAAARRAEIQLLVKRRYPDGTFASYAPLINVPVQFPSGGGALLSFPIAKGDQCLVIFNEASISEWSLLGIETEPRSKRRHSVNDAIALVGITSKIGAAIPPVADANDVVLAYGVSEFRVKIDGTVITKNAVGTLTLSPDGAFAYTNAVGEISYDALGNMKFNGGPLGTVAIGNCAAELLDLLDQLLDALISSVTATAIGAQPLSGVPQFVAIKALLALVKGSL